MGAVSGTFVGVPLQTLCNLVGGIGASNLVGQANPTPGGSYVKGFTSMDITNTAGSYTFYNPTTGNTATPSNSVTLIIAYEYDGAGLSSQGWGSYRLVAVGADGLVSSGSISVSDVDTITTSSPAGYTCNVAGVAQSTFNSGVTVYLTALGLSNSHSYTVEVVPYQSTWTVGMSIPTPVSTSTIASDSGGVIYQSAIYSNAAPGQYDIIVKATNDGTYDSGDLLITNTVSNPGAGLFVLPEYEIGALGALAACFAVFLAYAAFKKNISIPHLSKHARV